MFAAYTAVAILLAIGLTFSAHVMATRKPQIVEALQTVGVPESMYAPLAALKAAGAAGLIIGIFWRPLGIAAAIGLVLYFLGAVIAHLRVRNAKGAGVPAVLALSFVATLLLGTASA